MYKFYNRNASSIRAITIANCPWLNEEASGNTKDETGADDPNSSGRNSNDDEKDDRRIGNPLSHYQMNQEQEMEDVYRAGRGLQHILPF